MNLSIYNNYNIQKPAFSSLRRYTPIDKNEDNSAVTLSYCNETDFFRQPNQFEIMRSYLKNNFPNGTHILDYGCSDGEETYSIAMIIEDLNKKGKKPLYSITGYDASEKVIEMANKGKYFVNSRAANDAFLLDDDSNLTSQQNSYKESFLSHFKRTGEVKENVEVYNDVFAKQVCFEINKDDFKGIVDFVGGAKEGNIDQIDKTYKDKQKPGVVIFRNAWYHILENYSKDSQYGKEEIKNLKTILKKINNTLDDKGILVVGKLGRDHLLRGFEASEGIVDKSPFHKALYDCGFEPLKNSAEHAIINNVSSEDVKVYTIWKKVPPKKNMFSSIFGLLNKKAS